MRKSLMVFACVVATMLVFAVPAYATFSSHVLTGIPGGIAPLDSPSIQGGVCGDPNQYPVLNCPTTQDQLFVTRFRVYTNGNAAAQNVNAIAYLYYYANNAWNLSTTKNYGSCANLAGGGRGNCQFGSPSSSIVGNCKSYAGIYNGCRPAFWNIPAGYHWTVAIRLTWTNYLTGAVLARADYYPTPVAADIDCAYYAESVLRRCAGPRSSIPYNLYAPRNVGYLTLT